MPRSLYKSHMLEVTSFNDKGKLHFTYLNYTIFTFTFLNYKNCPLNYKLFYTYSINYKNAHFMLVNYIIFTLIY